MAASPKRPRPFLDREDPDAIGANADTNEVAQPMTTSNKAALPSELQNIVDEYRKSRLPNASQIAAKQIRLVFADKGWPDATHPQTVLDFMKEHNIAVLWHEERVPSSIERTQVHSVVTRAGAVVLKKPQPKNKRNLISTER